MVIWIKAISWTVNLCCLGCNDNINVKVVMERRYHIHRYYRYVSFIHCNILLMWTLFLYTTSLCSWQLLQPPHVAFQQKTMGPNNLLHKWPMRPMSCYFTGEQCNRLLRLCQWSIYTLISQLSIEILLSPQQTCRENRWKVCLAVATAGTGTVS